MRAEIRLRHYSLHTEQAYIDWARCCTYFHDNDKRHPQELGAEGGVGFPDASAERAQGVGFDAKLGQVGVAVPDRVARYLNQPLRLM